MLEEEEVKSGVKSLVTEKEYVLSPTNERPFQCKLCLSTFTHRHHLTKHLDRVHGVAHHACPKCDKKFTAQYTLRKHLAGNCEDICFPCQKCPKVFDGYSKLFNHLLQCHPLQCTKCLKTYSSQKRFKWHISTCTATNNCDTNLSCEKCPRKFERHKQLYNHRYQYHRMKCTLCPRTFGSQKGLERHKASLCHLPPGFPDIDDDAEEPTEHPPEIDDRDHLSHDDEFPTDAKVSPTVLYDNLTFQDFIAVLEGTGTRVVKIEHDEVPPVPLPANSSMVRLVFQETTMPGESEALSKADPISEPEGRTLLLENISYQQLLSVLRNPAVLKDMSPD